MCILYFNGLMPPNKYKTIYMQQKQHHQQQEEQEEKQTLKQ